MHTASSAYCTGIGVRVLRGVHRHRLHAQLLGGAHDAQRHLAAVRHQYLAKHYAVSGDRGRGAVGLDVEQRRAELHGRGVLEAHLAHRAHLLGRDLVHELHGLHDAQRLVGQRPRRPPERTAARRARGTCRTCPPWEPSRSTSWRGARYRRRRKRKPRPRERGPTAATDAVAAAAATASEDTRARHAHGDARALLLDYDLADAALLGDANQLANLIDVHVIVLLGMARLLLHAGSRPSPMCGACSGTCAPRSGTGRT